MKVHEVTQLQPLDGMYELKQNRQYLILLSTIEVSQSMMRALSKGLQRKGVKALLVMMRDTKDFRIFDVESLP